VFAVLVAAFASLPLTETAAIKIAVPPQRLETSVAMNSGGTANLAVQHLDAQVTDTAQGTATSTISLAPRSASGAVKLLFVCTIRPPCGLPWTAPAGLILVTPHGLKYVTESAATFTVGTGQYQTVGIHATTAGAAGNAGMGTQATIANNPRPVGTVGGVLTAQYLYAAGGTDAGMAQVIQQADLDAARTALAAKVTDELFSAMLNKAKGMAYIVDGPPALDFKSDHGVGEQGPTFTVTMTGELGARAFSDTAAQAILRAALQPLVLPGYELAPGSIQANYQFAQASGNAPVLVTADAVGYALPKISTSKVSAKLTGLSLSDAHSRLGHDFPGSFVEIRTRPLAMPWLPLLAEHISLAITIEPAV
jgi:hypothetical protein